MSKQKYSTKISGNSAKALGINLPVSPKTAIEVCSFIRNKKLNNVKKILEETIKKEKPIPFKKFNKGVGHRKGKITAGRYPVKTCAQILKIIKSAEANAQNKGLNSKDLVLAHINAHRGTRRQLHKRTGTTTAKTTHVEVILKEEK